MTAIGNGTSGKGLINTALVLAPPVTFACRWKPTSVGAQMGLIALCNSGSNTPFMRLMQSAAGKAMTEFRNDASGSSNAVGTTTLSTLAYQTLVGIIEIVGSDYVSRIYVANSLEASGAAVASSGAITLNNTGILHTPRLTIGNFAAGDIAQPGIWPYAWDSDDRDLFETGKSAKCITGHSFYQPVASALDEAGFVGGSMTGTDLTFGTDPAIDNDCAAAARQQSLMMMGMGA